MKYFLTCLLSFMVFTINAQNFLNGAMITYNPVEPESYTGSPFYEKEFVQGVVKNSQGESQNLFMRYNAANSNYYADFYKGSKSHFIGIPKLDLNSKEKAKTGYQDDIPANFQVAMQYYLSVDGGDFEEVYFRPKQIASLFNNSEMVNYISDQKVRKPEDVVALLKYYEKLK